MKKSLIILSVILNSFAVNVFSQTNGAVPIIYLGMDSTETTGISVSGIDSLAEGISGKARFFKEGSYLQVGDQNSLSTLWNDKDFSVEVWVQTKAKNENYPVIASNKDWNSGEIKDFTTNASFGISRTSGSNKGWAIICQPDGSWAWNIGDGKGSTYVFRRS